MPSTKTVPTGKGPVNFATAGKVIKPAAIKPATLATMVKTIDLKSIDAGVRSLEMMKVKPKQVSPLMSDVYKTSQDNALKLSKAVLQHAQAAPGNEDHARAPAAAVRAEAVPRDVVCARGECAVGERAHAAAGEIVDAEPGTRGARDSDRCAARSQVRHQPAYARAAPGGGRPRTRAISPWNFLRPPAEPTCRRARATHGLTRSAGLPAVYLR